MTIPRIALEIPLRRQDRRVRVPRRMRRRESPSSFKTILRITVAFIRRVLPHQDQEALVAGRCGTMFAVAVGGRVRISVRPAWDSNSADSRTLLTTLTFVDSVRCRAGCGAGDGRQNGTRDLLLCRAFRLVARLGWVFGAISATGFSPQLRRPAAHWKLDPRRTAALRCTPSETSQKCDQRCLVLGR